MFTYKGYTGVVEYDPTIERLAGHVVDLRDQIYFEGRDADEARQSFHRSVDGYLEMCVEEGHTPDRPYTGQIRVRVPSDVHRKVAVAASTEKKSMNDWIVQALETAVEKVGA